MQLQCAAVLGQPVRIQIDDDRYDTAVVIAETVTMLLVQRTRRIESEMTFVIVESEEKRAIQRKTQRFHDRQVLIASVGLARLQPPDLVPAYVGLQRLRRALAYARARQRSRRRERRAFLCKRHAE